MQAATEFAGRCQSSVRQTLRKPQRRLVAPCYAASGSQSAPLSAVRVFLRIPYRVHFGQSLGIVGAGELLGRWDGAKAVPMKWNAGDNWEAEICLTPGSPTQLEYKYVVLNSHGQVLYWKPGCNYKLDLLAFKGTSVRVLETWDDGGPRHVEVDIDPDTGSTAAQSSTESHNVTNSTARSSDQPSSANATPAVTQHKGSDDGPSTSSGLQAPTTVADGKGSGSNGNSSNGANHKGHSATAKSPRASRSRSRATLQPSTTVIQQEAQVAMSELKDALKRQNEILNRVKDPSDIEVIMGDRLLAAANIKAVALNRAVRAAEALPMLPPSIAFSDSSDSCSSSDENTSKKEKSARKAKI